ncbi:MAG: hypothetical protein GY898_18130 [Proteobacteria bacterium]|nr:hypothetical protein [Pseudomonadota bacterium]
MPELHQGCALLWGALCAPVFAAEGPAFSSLRLCSLLWHALLVAALIAVARKSAGRLGGLTAAVLLIAAPPSIVRASTIGLPDHIDAAALLATALFCVLELRDARSTRAAAAWSAAAGILSGLAVFFLFDALFVAALVCTAGWLSIREPSRTPRTAGLVGLTLGLSPFLSGVGWWATPQGKEVFSRLLHFKNPDGAGLSQRIGSLFEENIPQAVGLWDPTPVLGHRIPATLATWAYLVALVSLCLAVAAVRKNERARWTARFCLGAALIHLAACLGSGLDLTNWFYLLPIWPWLVVGAAVGAGHLFSTSHAGGVAAAACVALAACICSPYASVTALSGPTPVSDELRGWVGSEKGYSLLGHRLGYEHLLSRATGELHAAALSQPEHRAELLRLLGRRAVIEGTVNETAEVVGRGAPLFWLGVGHQRLQAAVEATEVDDPLGAASTLFAELDEPRTDYVVGIGVGLATLLEPESVVTAGSTASTILASSACFGMGLSSAENSVGTNSFQWVDTFTGCKPEAFAAGYGVGTGLRRLPSAGPASAPPLTDWSGREHSPSETAAYRCGLEAAVAASRELTVDSAADLTALDFGFDCASRHSPDAARKFKVETPPTN